MQESTVYSTPKDNSTNDNALTEFNLSENDDNENKPAAIPAPIINGNSKSGAHHSEKTTEESSINNPSKLESAEPSLTSAPCSSETVELNTANESGSSDSPINPSNILPDTESTNKNEPSSNEEIDQGQSKKHFKDLDSMRNSIHEHLSNLELVNGQSDCLESVTSNVGNTIELSNFFDENLEETPKAPSTSKQKNSDHDPDPPKISGEEQKASPKLKTEQTDFKGSGNSQQPTKVPREREGDENIEPSAKRLRTHDASLPITSVTSKSNNEKIDGECSSGLVKEDGSQSNPVITAYQIKEIIKIVRNISRTNAGKNFRQPVAVLWPSIAENYATKISNPMDLSTIEKKLKEEAYRTINDLKADVHLIYNNSVTFNSAENPVSKYAMETRNALFSKFSSIPPEPIPAPKKEKKVVKRSAPAPAPVSVPSPAPESATRGQSSKRTPRDSQVPTSNSALPSTQAFALDPTTNTPLIRRDSSKGDGGRPKREIHPPKNKDLPYTVRPKNKKHILELKFCDEVITELQKARYSSISHPFMVPVDPVALGIPNYFAIIKKPMDISTVVKKIKDGAYVNSSEFEKDVRQIFTNCYKYNPDGNPVRQMGKSFEEIFNNLWAKKDQFLAENTPSAASPSERETEDDTEDEELLDGATVTASLMSLKERLLEEQSKLINMMGAKHKDDGLLQMQTDLVELIQKRVKAAEEQSRKVANKKKAPKVVKKPAPAKKAVPAKKAITKKKYLGTLEKETISAGLGLIPAQVMATVVEMIKTERPELEVCIRIFLFIYYFNSG